ncbi:MAG: hypothetical protein D6721_02550 [Gammaproteobacteria bacterium]|nr:MAG: hypothetical protein D6721_02550 [Gammaproteobacteria bacterium]
MLHLDLPAQSQRPGYDPRPGALAEWVAALPLADPLRSASLLLERLRELNAYQLPARHRAELLRQLQPAYNRLHAPLRAAAGDGGRSRPREGAGLLALLTEQMLMGYQYVLQAAQAERGWRRPRHLQAAAHHAAHLLLLYFAGRYAEFLPVAPRRWQQLTALVEFTEHQRLDAVAAGDFPFARRLHAGDALGLLGALHFSDPYGLPQGQVWDVLGFAAAHVEDLRLLPAPVSPSPLPPGHFVLDRARLEGTTGPDPAACWRILVLAGLAARAREALAHSTPDRLDEIPGFSRDRSAYERRHLLEHLAARWQAARSRRHARNAQDGRLRLRRGLLDVWRLHNGDRPFDPLAWLPPEERDLAWDTRAIAASTNPRELEGRLRNRGAGGMGIQLASSDPGLRVGDLVCVTLPGPDGAPQRFTALVRWIRREGGGLSAGLHYVARNAQPLAARPGEAPAGMPYQPVLCHLPNMEGDRLLVLITPRGLYGEGRLLELCGPDQRRRVRCARLLEVANGLERFTARGLG